MLPVRLQFNFPHCIMHEEAMKQALLSSTRRINPHEKLLLQKGREEISPPSRGVAIKNWKFLCLGEFEKIFVELFMTLIHTLTEIWQKGRELFMNKVKMWEGLREKGFENINVVVVKSNEYIFLENGNFYWENDWVKLNLNFIIISHMLVVRMEY